nr:unnamed protein product [Digitaria exilis]
MNLIGDVRGKELLPKELSYCIKKELENPPAIERLSSGLFQEVIITNTIPLKEEKSFPQLTILSVANLLGETIWRVHDDCSVGHEPYSSLDID